MTLNPFKVLALLATVALAPPNAAADSMASCIMKKHPVPACSYDWDATKGRCTFKCSDPPDPAPAPAPTPPPPGNHGENDRVPSPDAPGERRTAPKAIPPIALDGNERRELTAYRQLLKEAQRKGEIKSSDVTAITERSELQTYRATLPKELQEKMGKDAAPR